MAKTKEEKLPKVERTPEEEASLAQMQENEIAIAEKSKEDEKRSAEEQVKVEGLRSEVQEAKQLEEGSPEWLAKRRQRRPSDE